MNKRINLALALMLVFASCKREESRILHNENNGREGIYSVDIIQKNFERKSFELLAGEIAFEGDTAKANQIKVIFFNPSGDTSSILFAKSGWYVEKTGNVGASGSVKVFSKKGDSLFTDTLMYNDSTGTIKSPSKVIIFRQGERIEGKGLISDVGFKHVTIGGKVIGESRKGSKE